MQKLLKAINFSKDVRNNLVLLDELLTVATNFGEVARVNRRVRAYQEQVKCLMKNESNLLIRLELRSLSQQLRSLSKALTQKTIAVLNGKAA